MSRAIYEQFDKAFASVSAFVLIYKGKAVGSVAFKYGARVRCFLHIHTTEMVSGYAGGGGYDRKSAAFAGAARKLPDPVKLPPGSVPAEIEQALNAIIGREFDGGYSWDRVLTDAGFTVAGAI